MPAKIIFTTLNVLYFDPFELTERFLDGFSKI